MNNKYFNSSRPGNDCFIHEHWYWCEPLRVAICVGRATGSWGSDKVETSTFDSPSVLMPSEVQEWFKEDRD